MTFGSTLPSVVGCAKLHGNPPTQPWYERGKVCIGRVYTLNLTCQVWPKIDPSSVLIPLLGMETTWTGGSNYRSTQVMDQYV
ncbi:hypothetical protein SLE2022_311020 [Rubroshorea leprosula]